MNGDESHTDAELRHFVMVRPRKGGKLYATCAVNLMLSWAGILGPIAPPEIKVLHRMLDACAPRVFSWYRKAAVCAMLYGELPAFDAMPDQAQRVYLNAMSR